MSDGGYERIGEDVQPAADRFLHGHTFCKFEVGIRRSQGFGSGGDLGATGTQSSTLEAANLAFVRGVGRLTW